jgi:hypothetical protein
MTCRELRNLAPLYHSGELGAVDREAFAAHRAACPECDHEIESQANLDSQIAGALARDYPDASRVKQRFRGALAAQRSRRRWILAAAAALVLVAGLGVARVYRRPTPAPAWIAAAARDHWSELVERQPRHWRTAPPEIAVVASQNGFAYAQVAALAPAGYKLERAKTCRIEGQPTLHLVFSDGAREYSVYLRPHISAKAPVDVVAHGAEHVAAFETGRYRAAVVTVGSEPECEALARTAASRL